jgi:hypothetical protein
METPEVEDTDMNNPDIETPDARTQTCTLALIGEV